MGLRFRHRRELLLGGLFTMALGLRLADWVDDQPDRDRAARAPAHRTPAAARRLPTRLLGPEVRQAEAATPASAEGIPSEDAAAPTSIHLRCDFADGGPPTRTGWLHFESTGTPERPVMLDQNGFWAGDVPLTGNALLRIGELEAADVVWTDGVCEPVVLPADALAMLRVRVEDPLAVYPAPEPVFVSGCGLPPTRLEPDEALDVMIFPDEACFIDAWRMDGLFRALAIPEPVELGPGEGLDVTMVLPQERMGGMGFAFRPDQHGVEITRVHEDTPASRSGLRNGDRIVSVDGESTMDIDPNDFVLMGTGPAGSAV
ncbi:MAG: PDZ domain-containing protein, partial [Myxococcota bacterium]|nr:PDZ domain-containing protein [Myxococcota bacterium]